MARMTPLTADQLEAVLQDRVDMTHRPQQTPRIVLAKWMDNFAVGVGVGVAAGVGLWLLGTPDSMLYSTAACAGLLTWGGMMAWRGSIDERSDWRNVRKIRQTVADIRRHHEHASTTLRVQLNAALDEIETLERSLDRMTHERDVAIIDLARERENRQSQAQRTTFVAPVELAPEEIRDASEMIRHRYDRREHLSRRKAEEGKGWPADRWKAAQDELVAAGLIYVNATQTRWQTETLDDALNRFAAYCLHARSLSVPAIKKTLGESVYVELE